MSEESMELWVSAKSDRHIEPRDVANGIQNAVNSEFKSKGACRVTADEGFHPESETPTKTQQINVTMQLQRALKGDTDTTRFINAVQRGAEPARVVDISWRGRDAPEPEAHPGLGFTDKKGRELKKK